MLGRWYSSGGFLISGPLVDSLQAVWRVALVGVSVVWLGRALFAFSQHRGEPIRVGLMLTSIAFYWNAYAWASNLLVGAAMFEIFHDVQYLAIVWMFNRRRVEQQAGVGRFVTFLFRRSGALVGCYVGLCFAFGSLKFFEGVATGAMRNILIAFLATSGLLHFYYDGFIWKIRDASTRRSLDLHTSRGASLNVPAAVHALKWAAFLLPVLWLARIEVRTRPDEASRWLQLTQSMPDSRAAHVEAARLLAEKGDDSKACLLLHRAVMLAPDDLQTRLTLARLLHREGRPGNALSQCQHVLSGEPSNSDARLLASRLLAEAGQLGDAEAQLRRVLDFEPERADAISNLGIVPPCRTGNWRPLSSLRRRLCGRMRRRLTSIWQTCSSSSIELTTREPITRKPCGFDLIMRKRRPRWHDSISRLRLRLVDHLAIGTPFAVEAGSVGLSAVSLLCSCRAHSPVPRLVGCRQSSFARAGFPGRC